MDSVALIQELVDFTCGHRRTLAVCSSRELAEEWINRNGGNQMVLLPDGTYAPKYRIDEYIIMNTITEVDPCTLQGVYYG